MTGKRMVIALILVLGLVPAQACKQATSTPVLKAGAATVCDSRHPLLIQVRPDGSFALNETVMDSARLAESLRTVLPPRPNRVVMVHLDTAHAVALRWIVPAIEASGGAAYRPDNGCVQGAPPPWWLP
jgi:biopolymer transport protein ExbD